MSARYVDYSKRTPGPHEYDNNTLRVKGHAPVFSMGNKSKSVNQITFDNNSYKPGPTSYEKKGTNSKSGAFIGG